MFVIPDDEVCASQALAPRVLGSSDVEPGPGQVFALESEHHLHLEAIFCLHWMKVVNKNYFFPLNDI